MTRPAENGAFQFERIPIPHDFDVCWAGPNPIVENGLCFGFTDGKVLFADALGRPLWPLGPGSDSGEAINGVARAGTWLGVSTREDVNLLPLPGTPGGFDYHATIPFGAHGITTTADGYFIAPLGRNGIMAVQPPTDRKAIPQAYSAQEPGIYAYRLIILHPKAGSEVIACATRLGGIAVGEFVGGKEKLNLKRATVPGLDVVDICPLEPGTESLAVAALGRDGSVALFQDVLHGKKSKTTKFRSVQGTAYSIFSSHGDIHILTSKGLYVLGELAGRFLRNELVSGITTPVRVSPMGAVDANLVYNRWLLIVIPGAVLRLDLEAVHREVLDHLGDAEIQESQAADGGAVDWEWREIETASKELALAEK